MGIEIEVLADKELLALLDTLEVDDPSLEIVLGEIERRNLDV